MGQTKDQTSWVPDACTLPAVDQPLRVAEFDRVFAESARTVERVGDTTVRIEFAAEAAVAGRVAELAMRESSCCSFFRFVVGMADGRLTLDVGVPATHVPVLEALAARAATATAGART